jgi:hypothetical protein
MDGIRLNNLRQAYLVLENRVQRAAITQVGDSMRLGEVQREVLSYIRAVEQVCRLCMLIKTCFLINTERSKPTSSQLRSFRIAEGILSS